MVRKTILKPRKHIGHSSESEKSTNGSNPVDSGFGSSSNELPSPEIFRNSVNAQRVRFSTIQCARKSTGGWPRQYALKRTGGNLSVRPIDIGNERTSRVGVPRVQQRQPIFKVPGTRYR